MPTEDIVVVGRIGSPHGVRGGVHLQSFTSPVENILDYAPWYLKAKGQQWRAIQDIHCRPHKKAFVATVEGVADRDAAAALTGQLIGVPATALPALADDDEFYWRELVGCRVLNEAGEELGVVDELLETGANDVLSVHGEDGDILIPFADDYVTGVDRERKIVTVNWDTQW